MSGNNLHKKAERLLEPFFSTEMLKRQFSSFLILWLTLGIFWPKKGLTSYIQSGNAPLAFLVVFVLALIIYSYINLIYGDREVLQYGRDPWVGYRKRNPFIAQRPYDIPYFFIGSLIQNLLLWLPVIPVLLISAGISGLSIRDTLKAFSILYMTSLVCGIFGSSVSRFFKNWRFTLFIITRSFFMFTFVGTGFLGDYANPILLIYWMHQGEEILMGSSLNAYIFYMAATLLASGILIFEEYIVVSYQNKRDTKPNTR